MNSLKIFHLISILNISVLLFDLSEIDGNLFYKSVDAAQKSGTIMKTLSTVLAGHMKVGDNLNITTPNLMVNIQKNEAAKINPIVELKDANASLPTFCNMTNQSVNETKPDKIFSILDLKYDPEEKNNCKKKIITFVVR